MPYALCPMPYALCPMPYALCPMPYALCPMPYALCPLIKRVPHVTEKGYIAILAGVVFFLPHPNPRLTKGKE
jgi:hypothetical protein